MLAILIFAGHIGRILEIEIGDAPLSDWGGGGLFTAFSLNV